jgi:hypothetical protein
MMALLGLLSDGIHDQNIDLHRIFAKSGANIKLKKA